MFGNCIGNFCPNLSIYYFEMKNIIKMIILKDVMKMFKKIKKSKKIHMNDCYEINVEIGIF
jgi:hypothetical protein